MTRNFIRLLKATSQATLISLALLPMTASADEGAVQIIWDCGETKPCIEFKAPPGAAGGQVSSVAGGQVTFVAGGQPQTPQTLIAVPEPTPLILISLGLAVLGFVRHRKVTAELKSVATEK